MNSSPQVSPIRGLESHEKLRISWKDRSELKYSASSLNQNSHEPLNMKLSPTTTVRRQESLVLIQEEDFRPVTNSINQNQYIPTHSQQRRLNDSIIKSKGNQMCKSFINPTSIKFAIQSEPNSMMMSRAQYFRMAETDYSNRIIEFSKSKQYGIIKLFNFLNDLNHKVYNKKVSLAKIKRTAERNKQTYIKSLGTRQLHVIDCGMDKKQKHLRNKRYNQQVQNKINVTDKVKVLYYNKLVGVCNPFLIQQQQFGFSDKDTESIYEQVEPSVSKMSQGSEKSYIFNFDIHPRPPKHSQKINNSNFNSKIWKNQ